MTVKFVLLVNKQGQTRLAKYTDQSLTVEERRALEGRLSGNAWRDQKSRWIAGQQRCIGHTLLLENTARIRDTPAIIC